MKTHDFANRDAFSVLGATYGVTWKAAGYTPENGELSTQLTQAISSLLRADPKLQGEKLLELAFQFAARSTSSAESFLRAIEEDRTRIAESKIRRDLISREKSEIVAKLKTYREQHDFFLFTLKKCRVLGWPVDTISSAVSPDADTTSDLFCLPWERHGEKLTKVRGFTHFFHGQWGDDPPDPEQFDGDHEAGSLFLCQKTADARNPHVLFRAHDEFKKSLEREISGSPS
jgi:hypothetical protein